MRDPEIDTQSTIAVRHLASSLAVEWATKNIRVNVISPGYMATALTRVILDRDPELRDAWVNLTPMGRIGEPEDLKGAVIYLASDASSFTTGADLRVDGGYTLVRLLSSFFLSTTIDAYRSLVVRIADLNNRYPFSSFSFATTICIPFSHLFRLVCSIPPSSLLDSFAFLTGSLFTSKTVSLPFFLYVARSTLLAIDGIRAKARLLQ